MDPYLPLFQIVRSQHEHVKIAIEADITMALEEGGGRVEGREQGIIAVVSNVEHGHEECCILVCKRRRKDRSRVKVWDGLAVGSDFQATVQQQSSSGTSSDGARLQLTMTSRGKTVRASSNDSQDVKDLLAVAKDATRVTAEQQTPPNHEWVQHYLDTASGKSSSDGNGSSSSHRDVPIFSRFTISSINPPDSTRSRPRPPSPGEGEIKLSVASFNVNGQMPGETDLKPWLHIAEDEPDVLLVGLQEAESSNLSYVVWTPHVEDGWCYAVETSMGRRGDEYVKLASKQLVGILTLVYVRKEVLPRISGLATSSVGVGFGGWGTNKGATGIRFDLDGVSLCLVVSHLSAFDTMEARERRRWDYGEIVKRMRFTLIESEGGEEEGEDGEGMMSSAVEEKGLERDAEAMLRAQLNRDAILHADDQTEALWANDSQYLAKKRLAIMDHDVVFWTGDLNFRLELGIGEVKRLIQKKQFANALLNFDQLRSEMGAQTCFQGFEEQEITFAPTYKFDRGTDVYDTSEKKRVPSWTDRVLWKQSRHLVQPVHYESCPVIQLSDHKPVLATFLLHLDGPGEKGG